MKKLFTLLLLSGTLTANAQYQLKNAGFEEWEDVSQTFKAGFPSKNITRTGVEPLYWNSFITGNGTSTYLNYACENQLEQSSEVRPGSTGQYSAKLFDRHFTALFVQVTAQGNMTTGRINMGAMSADNSKGNYNYTDTETEGGNQTFTGQPDAMRVWVKYVSSDPSYRAKANTILHTEGRYQDPYNNDEMNTASLVAKAEDMDIRPKNEWQELTIPFEYSNMDAQPAYALVTFSTNKTPGTGSSDTSNPDYMLVDDLEYLYYSDLTSLKYNGSEYFEEEKTSYDLSNEVYDENKLEIKSNGQFAKISKIYNSQTGLLTIKIEGNNISEDPTNVHTYTVQFKEAKAEIEEYTNDLTVSVNGNTSAPQSTTIQLIKEVDGSTSFALNNFILGGEMLIGNIRLTNLVVDGNTYTAEQTINIEPGDMEGIGKDEWFGPMLGDVPVKLIAQKEGNQLTANIDINMILLGQEIKVIFAPSLTIDGSSDVNITTNKLYNVTLSRTFPAGWNTICLPFATTTAAFGQGVKAQAFISADNNGLNFGEVTELEANKPYLIYFKEAKKTPTYFGTEITSTTPVSVTFGDFTFCGSYEASIIMAGKYGVADQGNVQKLMLGGEGSTLKATRAYFTKSGDQPAMININLDGNATGIENIEQNQADIYDIYNLQGQLIRKNATSLNGLAKGIYIVNGKKVMVK